MKNLSRKKKVIMAVLSVLIFAGCWMLFTKLKNTKAVYEIKGNVDNFNIKKNDGSPLKVNAGCPREAPGGPCADYD